MQPAITRNRIQEARLLKQKKYEEFAKINVMKTAMRKGKRTLNAKEYFKARGWLTTHLSSSA